MRRASSSRPPFLSTAGAAAHDGWHSLELIVALANGDDMVHSPDPFTRSALLHALASVQRAAEHSARSAACVLARAERRDGDGGVALVELRSSEHAQLVGMLQLLSATLPDGELCARTHLGH